MHQKPRKCSKKIGMCQKDPEVLLKGLPLAKSKTMSVKIMIVK